VLDRLIESTLIMQERAGMDELTDGGMAARELRQVIAEECAASSNNINIERQLVVSRRGLEGGITFARSRPTRSVRPPRTKRRVKVTLPSPYIIGCRLWNPEHSKAAYPNREKLDGRLRTDSAAGDRSLPQGGGRHRAARRAVVW